MLDDLSPLREVNARAGSSRPHLFTPAAAYRLRANNNRDTPLPPSEPVAQNPPAGAVIDYWLPATATAPVEIEIRDAAGRLVNQLSSDPVPDPEGETYFSRSWLRPSPGLSHEPGMHRAIWNLRYPRPQCIKYEYSIAATYGVNTPVDPQGALVLPGTYQVILKVDGTAQRALLRVLQDPRARPAPGAMQASLALHQRIAAALGQARRGFGETTTIHEQLGAMLGQLTAQPSANAELVALSPRVKAMIERTAQPKDTTGFYSSSETLTGIAIDLEASDRAPTGAQVRYAGAAIAGVDIQWQRWTQLRDGELQALRAALRSLGLPEVSIPPPDQLVVKPPDPGADLP